MQINSAKDLTVYKRAYALAMEIFQISKQWLIDERYSLIDQIRRASTKHAGLAQECREIGAMLGSMIQNPNPFLVSR